MNLLNLYFFAVLLVYSVQSDQSKSIVLEYESSADEYKDKSDSPGNDSGFKGFGGSDIDEELSKLEEGFDSKMNKKGQIFEPHIESYGNGQKYSKKWTSQESNGDKTYNKGSKNIGHKKSYEKGNHKKYGTDNRYEESYGELSNSKPPEHKSNQNKFSISSKIAEDETGFERVERSANLEQESIEESKKKLMKKSQNNDNNRKSNMKIDKNGNKSKKKNSSNRQKRSFDYFGIWN